VLYAYAALPMPRGHLQQPTLHSLATAADLEEEAADIRQRGYAVTREELEIGLNAAAVPVRGSDGDVIAALGVSGPSARLGTNLDEIGKLLIKHGDDLSQLLRRRTSTRGAK
jgi:DNA-binding IclR family transcriptional regulator